MALSRAWIGQPQLEHMAADGGITRNFIGDYTVQPIEANYTAPHDLLVVHFAVVVKGVGTGLQSDAFCTIPELPNGFQFGARSLQGEENPDGVMPGNVITKSNDFLRWAENVQVIDWGLGIREVGFVAHYEPYKNWGTPFYLPEGSAIYTKLSDDFTGLTELAFHIVAWKMKDRRGDTP
jgi:hypothetical protein